MSSPAQAIQTWGGAAIGVFGQYLTAAQIATIAAARAPEPVTASYPVSQQVMLQIMTNHPNWFTNGSMVSDDLLTQQGGIQAAAAASPASVIPITQAVPVPTSAPTSTATLVAPTNTAAVAATGNWFTDPAQEVVSGLPNMYLAGGAALLLLLFLMKKKK